VTFAALLGEEAPVIRLRYEKCGQSPGKADHPYPAEEAQVANASDDAPFDVTAWRRASMRPGRAWSRAGQAPEPEKQPQVEENSVDEAPPVKERKPPSKGERGAGWAAHAEEMKTLAENMLMDDTRAMLEHGSGLRAHVGAPTMTASGYRMGRTGGLLRAAVEAYLRGGEITPTGLMALQAYLKRSITGIGGARASRASASALRISASALRTWIRAKSLKLGSMTRSSSGSTR
jgi:hypothetical protein